jgi:hypothetical protein
MTRDEMTGDEMTPRRNDRRKKSPNALEFKNKYQLSSKFEKFALGTADLFIIFLMVI